MAKKPDDKQRRLDEIAEIARETLRGPTHSHDYYFRQIREMRKLAEGE